MKEYIDRELLLKETKEYRENDPWWAIRGWWDAYRRRRYFTLFGLVVSKFPAADVVEVVRCKDCKYFTEGMAVGMCKRIPDKPIIPMPYNNYCGFGERRNNHEM